MKFNINEYPTVPLPDLLSLIVDNRGKTVPTADTGHILIATNCIRNENLYPVYERIRFVPDDVFQTWFRAHPQPGDIIFVNKGTPGRVCMVPDPIDFCIAQDMMAFRCNPKKVYNKYLFAILRSEKIQKQIQNSHVGSLIPHFKKDHLRLLEIPVPPMEIQKVIGDTYFDFSEAIENNKRMNRSLLEYARTIFEEKVVSSEAHTDEWQKESLDDIATYLNGLAMQKYRPAEDEDQLPVLKIRELRQGYCDENTEYCTSSIDRSYVVSDGDVVFSWSGSLLVDFWCGGDVGLNQHLFKVSSARFDKWFYYSWTQHHLSEFIAIAADKATTMGHIKRSELKKAEVYIPPRDAYQEIGRVLQPLYEKVIENRLMNRQIETARDTILTNLFNGEVEYYE